jgi:hypothetical protein
MSLLIEWPWLALIPALLFGTTYRLVRRPFVAVTALAWAAYALYEYGMQRRWLCSGECNIRVDLLLLYPLLVIMSVMASVMVARAIGRPRAAR